MENVHNLLEKSLSKQKVFFSDNPPHLRPLDRIWFASYLRSSEYEINLFTLLVEL